VFVEGSCVKQPLPPYWTVQLIGIILLFSVGLTLFPLSYIGQQIQYQSVRPELAYHERFQANLTAANSVVVDSLGECSDITIYDWSVNPTAVLYLRIKDVVLNETVVLLPLSHTFNTSGYASLNFYLPSSVYTVEAYRVANDTFFECVILAYNVYPMSPPVPLVYYGVWPLGFIMICLGVLLTYRFINRTKDFM